MCMNKTKKSIVICLVCFCFCCSLLPAETGLETAWIQALDHNTSIIEERIAAESADINAAGLEGTYTPGISTSYKKTSYLTSQIGAGITQKLPGGLSLSLSGSKVFVPGANPYLEITTSARQSLAPFWLLTDKGNPLVNSYRISYELQQTQLNSVQKEIVMEVTQQYIMAIVSLNELMQYENSLAILQEKKDALHSLYLSGNNSYTDVIALQNQIFSTEQDRNSVYQSYVQYVASLEKLAGTSNILTSVLPGVSELLDIFPFSEDFTQTVLVLSCSELQNQLVLTKESTAPVVELTYTWTESSWQAGVALDVSNWLTENTGKTGVQLQNKLKSATIVLENYLSEKQITRNQYASILTLYRNQYDMLTQLTSEAERQLNDTQQLLLAGEISELDYKTLQSEVENLRLSEENTRLMIWLYTFYLQGC